MPDFIHEQDPFWLLTARNDPKAEPLSQDDYLLIFTSEERAICYLTSCKLNLEPKKMTWYDIVEEYCLAFPTVIINPSPNDDQEINLENTHSLFNASPQREYQMQFCQSKNEQCEHLLRMDGELCCCKDVMSVAWIQEIRGKEKIGAKKECDGWAVRSGNLRKPFGSLEKMYKG